MTKPLMANTKNANKVRRRIMIFLDIDCLIEAPKIQEKSLHNGRLLDIF